MLMKYSSAKTLKILYWANIGGGEQTKKQKQSSSLTLLLNYCTILDTLHIHSRSHLFITTGVDKIK